MASTKHTFGQALFIGLFTAMLVTPVVLGGWWMVIQSILWAVNFQPDFSNYQPMGWKLVTVGAGLLAFRAFCSALSGGKLNIRAYNLTGLLLIGGSILNALY